MEREPQPIHAAFVIPYTNISFPWIAHPEQLSDESHRGLCVPRLLMIQRADGSFGFPGGHTEPCDTSPEGTVIREAMEETELTLNPVRLHHMHTRPSEKGNAIAIFSHHLGERQLQQAAANYRLASHHAEISGVILPHIIDYRHPDRKPRFEDLRISELPYSDNKTKEDVITFLAQQNFTRN